MAFTVSTLECRINGVCGNKWRVGNVLKNNYWWAGTNGGGLENRPYGYCKENVCLTNHELTTKSKVTQIKVVV